MNRKDSIITVSISFYAIEADLFIKISYNDAPVVILINQ